MNTPPRIRLLSGVAVLLFIALTGPACAERDSPEGAAAPSPTPSVTTSESPTPAPSPSISPTPSPKATAPALATGPVWPLEPWSLGAEPSAQTPVLKAIRTSRYNTYDRVVFEFSRVFGTATVRYVPLVHARPSGLIVALRGNAFLDVSITGAYARSINIPPVYVDSYTGPDSVTPGYPTLKQVTLSGDFGAVVSFGIGLDRTAGFRATKLTDPNRLVIDLAHVPAWQMWPDTSLTQARQVQASFDAGQVPWRSSVVAYYATRVYGWNDPVITRISGTNEYWVSAPQSTERIRVRQVWPFAATHQTSIAEIADVR